ncbi:ATP-binding cassette sub-family C member 4-like isoform X1 [Lineus longissimus]|uniref:ATP-binding cassette sub-family C member 4-like isoform X1 n=1 Tax=Lineus longissimus TaxID=88925 RepID=UPI00315DDA57
MDEGTKHHNPNPVENANCLSKVLYWWLSPLFSKGAKSGIEKEDLYNVCECDSADYLTEKLGTEWKKESCKIKEGENPSLLRALCRAFGKSYMLLGMLVLIEESVKILQPLLLVGLIKFFSNQTTLLDAYLYAAGVSICAIFLAVFHHPYFFGVLRVGMQLRVACSSLIYRKSLRLSNTAMKETTVGQIVNLMSNDCNRFDTAVIFIHYLWVGPLTALATLGILWYELGPSCLAGFAVLLLLVPVQYKMGKFFTKLRLKTAVQTDERVRIMHEIISGMRIIKMYCWERMFGTLIKKVREREMKRVQSSSYAKACNLAPYFVSPKLFVFLTFVTYVFTGHMLTAAKVFLVITLYNTVRLTMTLFLPFAIQFNGETKVTINRLEKFLTLDELEHAVLERKNSLRPKLSDCGVVVKNLTASWDKTGENTTLKDISLSVSTGELVAVIGPVGSGKSSLLMAILGEMMKQKGEITLLGHIAYTSQEPWVFSSSVKQNIIFGQECDLEKYDRVLKACALEKDIEMLPDKDLTLVGERGVSLSGGQRARVSLARALYRSADIYLFDDPLSAVDSAVGKHLFDQCINGMIRNKPRILVTHQLQYLKVADRIVILRDGQIADTGTYNELAKSGIDFAALLNIEEEELDLYEGDPEDEKLVKNVVDLPTHEEIHLDYVGSMLSVKSLEFEMKPDHVPIQKEEKRSEGVVQWHVYKEYFKASGSGLKLFLLVVLNILAQVAYILCDWWLSYWAVKEEQRHAAQQLHDNLTFSGYNQTNITVPYVDTNEYIYIFSGIILAVFVFGILRALLIYNVCVNSARTLHNNMFDKILRAPVFFFDTNPIGRILNVFSKDMGLMDEFLPSTLSDFLQCFLLGLGIILVAGIVNPWVFIPCVPLAILFVMLRQYYMKSSRDIKRLEAVTRSPIYSHLSATLNGLHTVRAYGVEEAFITEYQKHQDQHTEAWYLFLVTTRWFAVRLDFLCSVFVSIVCFCSVFSAKSLDGGLVGLSVTYAIALMGMFQWGVRQSTEVENQMVSVERILEYSAISSEKALDSDPEKKPPKDWPSEGTITADGVNFRYSSDNPLVLKDIKFHIKSKEKIGIVGRTGAGKSSLMAMLFRMAEPSGDLKIDGIQITDIGLHDLRRKISIIPQDPTLFSGTLRKNLDPFSQYADVDLWRALDEVELKPVIEDLPGRLECSISEGGSNFSVGQRQLICLARAVLRRNKILVIDEATANVDPRTDALIQETIRAKFQECTVLTIAHRLHTIMDSDRLLVLDEGRVVEFDQPHSLITSKQGFFYDMVQSTGDTEAYHLEEIARVAHEGRKPQPEKANISEKKVSVTSSVDKVIMNGPNHVSESLSSPCSESHDLSSNPDFDDDDVNEDSPLLAHADSEPDIDIDIDMSSIPLSLQREMKMLTGEEPPIHAPPPSGACSRVRVPKIHVTSPSYHDLHGETEEVKNDEVYPKTTSVLGDDELMPKITVTSPSVQDLHGDDSDEEGPTGSSSGHPNNNKKRTNVSSDSHGPESNTSVSDKETAANDNMKPKITVTSPSLNKIADDGKKRAKDDDSMDVPKITVTSPSIQDLHDDDSNAEKDKASKKGLEESGDRNTKKQETDDMGVPKITVTSPSLNDLQNDENGNDDETDSSEEYSDSSSEGEYIEGPKITVTSPSFQDLQNENECNGNGKHSVSSSDEEDVGDKAPLLKDMPASAVVTADGDDNEKMNMDYNSVC